METKHLIQYVAPDGRVPFRDWLYHFKDVHTRARIRTRLDRLVLGNPGDFKAVGKGIFELRFHFGSGYRVYYAEEGKTVILLLCGGDKSSQKRDIVLAQTYWEDYQRRSP